MPKQETGNSPDPLQPKTSTSSKLCYSNTKSLQMFKSGVVLLKTSFICNVAYMFRSQLISSNDVNKMVAETNFH
jgi:hypothetical protein